MKGKLKSLVPQKGYGFIKADGNEFFFHRDDFSGHWQDLITDYEQDKEIEVQFEPGQGPKGPRAAKVSRLDHPNQAVTEVNNELE